MSFKYWEDVIDRINFWRNDCHEHKSSFIQEIEKEYLLVEKSAIKEIQFEDEYVMYLVKEEEPNEERKYDA